MLGLVLPATTSEYPSYEKGCEMSPIDLIIILVVLAVFALCVRSMIRGAKSGECADCASGGSCNAGKGGHCKESAKLMGECRRRSGALQGGEGRLAVTQVGSHPA